MNLNDLMLRDQTRRHFFENCAVGAGAIGLASLLQSEQRAQASSGILGETHHPAKAKNVIYMFMAGGPSQLEMFDYKPKLQELEGKVIPESYVEGKQFAFLKKDAKLLGTRRKFKKYGESGTELSDVVPHLASIADDITVLKSMKTDVFNHGPAKLFMNTGTQQFGRPSMGILDYLRNRQRIAKPARLCGAAVRSARAPWRFGTVGQRISAHHVSGSALPEWSRSDSESLQPGRNRLPQAVGIY
jgi:hypothetical protein